MGLRLYEAEYPSADELVEPGGEGGVLEHRVDASVEYATGGRRMELMSEMESRCHCERGTCGFFRDRDWCRHWFVTDWVVPDGKMVIVEELEEVLQRRWCNELVHFYAFEMRLERFGRHVCWRLLVYVDPAEDGWCRDEADWQMRLPGHASDEEYVSMDFWFVASSCLNCSIQLSRPEDLERYVLEPRSDMVFIGDEELWAELQQQVRSAMGL